MLNVICAFGFLLFLPFCVLKFGFCLVELLLGGGKFFFLLLSAAAVYAGVKIYRAFQRASLEREAAARREEMLRRARRDPAAAFILLGLGVMSLPTLLASDAPHFLRAAGLLPLVAFLPTLGLEAGLHALRTRRYAWLLAAVPLLCGLASTTWDYFALYAPDPRTAYWFEDGAVALGEQINSFLGDGWDGQQMLHGDPGTRHVYVDPGLWSKWPQARFVVTKPDWVVARLDVCPGPTASGPVAVFAWPYGDWPRAWRLLPAPAEISVTEGPLSQGDNDPQPYTTYVAFFAAPSPAADAPLARFGQGIELLAVQTTVQPQGGVLVRLRWHATAAVGPEYTAFVHYLRDGEVVAQGDGPPALGYLPTAAWRPGDVVNDEHLVPLPFAPDPARDQLRVGLWLPQSGEMLPVTGSSDPWVVLPLDGGGDD